MTTQEFAQKIKQKYPQYQNVDDNELVTKIVQKYPEYKSQVDFGGAQQEQNPGGIMGAVKSGWQGLKDSFNKRVDNMSEIGNREQSVSSRRLQQFGQGVGLVGDTIGSAVGAVASAVTPDFIEKPVVEGFKNVIAKGLQTETAQNAMKAWDEFKMAHPEAAGNIEALVNIGGTAAQLTPAGRVTELAGSAVLKAGETASKAALNAGRKVGNKVSQVAEYGTSQATGLNPNTIRQVLETPGAFTAKEMAKIDRESFANKIKSAVEKRLEALSTTGKEYDAVRKSGQVVSVPEGTIQSVLNKYGIDVVDGKVVTTAESVPLGQGDINAIEGFIKQYGQGELSGNAFLNARKALSNMAKFDATKTDMAQKISRELRSAYDELGKAQIKGLSDLDAKYAPEVKLLGKIRSELFAPDGSLKDTAISRLANLTGKGKEKALERMERIVPGIREQVNILKSIEDIEFAKGQKVGTYVRGAVAGGGLVTGNVPAIIGAIVSSPNMAIPLLRGFAKAKNVSSVQVNKIIDKMKSGASLVGNEYKLLNQAVQEASQKVESRIKKAGSDFMKDPKAGMSIKAVDDPLLAEARKYKTAEEFVKAQGTPVYHGSPAGKLDKIKSNNGVVYVTREKSTAAQYKYARNVDDKGLLSERERLINHYQLTDDVSVLPRVDEIDRELSNIVKSGKSGGVTDGSVSGKILNVNKDKNFLQDAFNKMSVDGLSDVEKRYVSNVRANGVSSFEPTLFDRSPGIRKKLFEQGISGIEYPHGILPYSGGKEGTQIALTHESALKTKSQLTDLWNKANKKNSR